MSEAIELNLPALPNVSLARINLLRDKLTSKLTQFEGRQADTAIFPAVVDAVTAVMPAGINRLTIQNSVLALRDVTLTADVIVTTCWRLASSVERLKLGVAVPAWALQTSQEWVLCQIVDVFPYKRAADHGVLLSFEVLTGSPVGLRVTQFWSLRKTAYVAHCKTEATGYSFGFSRTSSRSPDNVYEYSDARQLFGLHAFMLAAPSKDRELNLTVVAHTSATMNFNRDLLRNRRRESGKFACPMGYPVAVLCHQCPIGRDKCLVACHSLTYISGQCTKCSKSNVFIDPVHYPQSKTAICVNCNFAWARR